MRIHVLDVTSGEEAEPITLPSTEISVGLDVGDGQLKNGKSSQYGLTLARNGRGVVVINRGSPQSIFLQGQLLPVNVTHAWLENQDLQIGDQYLLRWDVEPTPLYRPSILPIALIVLAGLLAAALMLLFGYLLRPLPVTLGHTESLNRQTAIPAMTAPGPTPTLQSIISPSPTEVYLDVRDAPSDTFIPVDVVVDTGVTGPLSLPCESVPPQPAGWDPLITMQVEAACVRTGESYWQLLRAEWLKGEEYDGYHHLFVDVVDERMNRVYGTSFVMSWPDGNCRRYIRGIAEPIDHGEHCVMFDQAGSYAVMVEGLPSEVVTGLGLGAVNPQAANRQYMTSFYLLFQRTAVSGE